MQVSPKRAKNGNRAKCKSPNNMFLRYLFCFVVVVMLLPLFYVNLVNLNETTIQSETTPIKKNLENFQERSSQNDHTATTDGNFDFQAEKASTDIASLVNPKSDKKTLVLTAYLEPPETLIETDSIHNPFIRNTSIPRLRSIRFPNTNKCTTLIQDFPVDDFPLYDPFLPWIHDYSPSLDSRSLHFVAQNRRKCDTGVDNKLKMKFWTPQVALFQGIPIVVESPASTQQSKFGTKNDTTIYRLASSYQEATHNATRFQCRFHHDNVTVTTLSVFPFDYEFMNWIKGQKTMIEANGKKDTATFWLNQLLFSCPIPEVFQPLLSSSLPTSEFPKNRANNNQQPAFYVDLIPIRTPARSNYLFLSRATGTDSDDATLKNLFGTNHILPPMDDVGRWQNLPICHRSDHVLQLPGRSNRGQLHNIPATDTTNKKEKPYRLVACTWTSSSYQRRGESSSVSDSDQRLREWIQFHLMVGFDHVYIYDNSDKAGKTNSSGIHDITQSFERNQVTYHAWPCKICNNNRPANNNPGVRSSQYSAESSCRTRYGELSDWMTFIDTDEYLVPMKQNEDGDYSWHPVMDEMEKKDISIMKFLSSRGKPRIEFTENLKDQLVCADPNNTPEKTSELPVEPCVGPMKNKTFLQVYNCDFIPPPKPKRFSRAMKQIYRPSFVLSHFVHYSVVTTDMSQSYSDFMQNHTNEDYRSVLREYRRVHVREKAEMFMNELTQGVLVHARSVLPHETRRRSAQCLVGSKYNCVLGYLCGDNVEFVDELHTDNVFHNLDGSYCNCWRNKVIDDVLVPKLETLMSSMH